jgi:hypothetical protein
VNVVRVIAGCANAAVLKNKIPIAAEMQAL